MLDRLLAWRDRLVGDPGFQSVVGRVPLLRGIGRREAGALFDLCAGAVYAQVLVACLKLDLFELLAAGPLTVEAIAADRDLPAAGATALLDAAAALRLLERRRCGRFGLGMLGAALRANPGIAAMVAHHDILFDDLRDPVALLRAQPGHSRLAAYWAYAANAQASDLGSAAIREYSALMTASQPMVAEQVVGAYDLRQHRCLLDVGGGEGRFLIAAAAAAPNLELRLFDLPAVAEQARQQLATAGLTARSRCFDGDFSEGELPQGADLISFVRVLHDHDDATVRRMLAAARAALPANGRVLIAEPMADTPRVTAYFSMYLLAMGSGRPRRAALLKRWLQDAGFTRPRTLPTALPLVARVIVADCKS